MANLPMTDFQDQVQKLGPGAEVRLSLSQKLFGFFAVLIFFTIGTVLNFSFLTYMQIVIGVCTVFFVLLLGFSLKVVISGVQKDSIISMNPEEIDDLYSTQLPFITIIVAAYKEANVIKKLVESMQGLYYPESRKEVIIVLEEKDTETIEAISLVELPSNFKVVIRPHGGVKTKPAALNYLFETGYVSQESNITVVFDAEDEPNRNQLLQAVKAFEKSWEINPSVVVVQARLAFSQNATANWLTQMLNLDYINHFGLVLPGLSRLGYISPLGGTSNYILTDVIRELLWDKDNVTEDLDLAVRLARLGLGIRVFESTTAEEAVESPRDFVNQRSRWIKGGIQTYFRHMRNPVNLYQDLGPERFISFQFVVGAPLLLNLVNPIFWSMTLFYAVTHAEFVQMLYPPVIFYLGSVAFVFGNFAYIYFLMVASFKTKQYGSVFYALFSPIYWILLSIAGMKAAKEFAIPSQTHKWAKTEHKGRKR